jgi:hypothetical protein
LGYSDYINRVGAGSFGAATFLVRYALTFAQVFEGDSLHRGLMEKQLTILTLDKAKAFVRNELFDRAFGHATNPLVIKIEQRSRLPHATASMGQAAVPAIRAGGTSTTIRNVRGRPLKSELRGRFDE